MPIGVNERNKIDAILTTPIGVNRRHKIDAITIISISTLPFSQINICFVKFLFYALTVDMVSYWYLYLMFMMIQYLLSHVYISYATTNYVYHTYIAV